MKRITLICAVAMFTLIVASAMAAPYASLIRVSSTTAAEGFGLDISYVLNYSPDTVTIEIKNSSDATVATFAGTTAQGRNTVSWDGTVDNAGGSAVAAGTGFYVSITVDNNDPESMTKYAENLSGGGGGGQVFAGFSPDNANTFSDTDSDNFGILLMGHSWNGATPKAAAIQFTMDGLTEDLVDGTSNVGLIHPDQVAGTAYNGSLWDLTQDPDDENIFYNVGQGDVQWTAGDVSSGIAGTLLADNDDPTTPLGFLYPRDGEVKVEGPNKYLYYVRSNGVIGKVKITAGLLDSTDHATNITSDTVATYSKDIEFDASGNLYFVSRSGAPAPILYRWDAADVLAAPGTLLGTDNATWTVDFPTTCARAMGAGITNGKVYVCTYGATAAENAIYEIGSTATASINGTAGEDVGAEMVSGADNPDCNNVYSNLGVDVYGNLFTFDRGSERLQCWTLGGNTSITINGPTSQDFDIVTPPSGISEWQQLM